MTRAEAHEIFDRYNMEYLINNSIEELHIGGYCVTDHAVPELDALAQQNLLPCAVTAECIGGEWYRYKLVAPAAWMDRSGWKEEE